MDKDILPYVLKNYPAWKIKQNHIETKFLQGKLTRWELVYASMELLAEHMPDKPARLDSHSGAYK